MLNKFDRFWQNLLNEQKVIHYIGLHKNSTTDHRFLVNKTKVFQRRTLSGHLLAEDWLNGRRSSEERTISTRFSVAFGEHIVGFLFYEQHPMIGNQCYNREKYQCQNFSEANINWYVGDLWFNILTVIFICVDEAVQTT